MVISQIVAASENNVIGKNNSLPWHMPNDMEYFKRVTMGHYVITGRKNYESEGNALPGRTNIVITREKNYSLDDAIVAHSLDEALSIPEKSNEDEVFIIGGGKIYEISLSLTDRIYLTRIHAVIKGDVYFPKIDPDKWEVISEKRYSGDANHAYDYTFYVYERIKH